MKNRTALIIYPLLYFSEGAPIGFIWWALPGMLREAGHSLSAITLLTSTLTLPWIFKFLFAPIVDIAAGKQYSLKKILLGAQICMTLFLVPLLYGIHSLSWTLLIASLFLHALSAAFQDVTIDTLVIRTIPDQQMGKINGLMQAGMLGGRAIFGGLSIYLIKLWGEATLLTALVITIAGCMLAIRWLPQPNQTNNNTFTFSRYGKDLIKMIRTPEFSRFLLIAFFAGFVFEGIGTITSTVLVNKGWTAELRSLFYTLVVPLSLSAGAIFSGNLADSLSPGRLLLWILPIMFGSSMIIAFMYQSETTSISMLFALLGCFYFLIGGHTAALYAYLMEETPKEFAALGFSTAMALTNLCESISGSAIGYLHSHWGFFISITFLASFSLFAWKIILRGASLRKTFSANKASYTPLEAQLEVSQ